MNEFDVVIVGAGPNGLMLAGELALAGLHPVVIDMLPGPSDEPKANGLVGQVIRTLDMRGLYRRITGSDQAPQPIDAFTFSGIPVSFAHLDPNPMYALLIAQPRLVRELYDWTGELGVEVRWGNELTDLRASEDRVDVDVAGPCGSYHISGRYLVGADGGHSRVRKLMGIGFPGFTADVTMRLAHVRIPEVARSDGGAVIAGDQRITWGHNRFDRGGLVFADFEPQRSMVGTIEFGADASDEPMSLDDLRRSVGRVVGAEFPIEAPVGDGPHALRRIDKQNTRHAERYRSGRVLLLGDAAHVHSAMGGPGLNLGLQDAVNLGWKLAATVQGWAPQELLDSYDSERRPVGERVMMHSLAQTALFSPGPEVAALRTLFGDLVRQPAGAEYIANLLAGSDIRYDVGDAHPLSGRMVPEVVLHDGRRVAELLHAARPVLLDFSGGVFADAAGTRVDAVVSDTGVAGGILVRPDGYVAWASDSVGDADVARLREALQRWCAIRTTTS